jgi:polyhydroxybutyrate depolymerase
MPVILIQGNSDPLVPFEGGSVKSKAGGPILSHQGTIDYWVKTDHCLPTPAITKIPDNAQDGTTVSYSLYSGGDHGAEVAGYVIEDGGHTWPGGWQYLPKMLVGRTTRNLDASRIIWEFFKKHPKAG